MAAGPRRSAPRHGRPSAADQPRARASQPRRTRAAHPSGAVGMHGVLGRRPQRPQRRATPLVAAIVVVAVLAVCVGALLFAILAPKGAGDAPTGAPQETKEVVIPAGSGGDVIAQRLLEAGIISDETAFMQAVIAQKAEQKIQPGTYLLSTGMPIDAVVQRLVNGPNTQVGRLTVPEGLTVAKTAQVVEEALGIPAADFEAAARASAFVADYPFLEQAADDSLEGFLWAKTYDFSGRDTTADAVIRAMLDQYAQEIPAIDFGAGEADLKARYGIEVGDYDILKLASIIEREAVSESDLPLVSSVFWNRMGQGMALQSDATMGYVTGGEVSADDLKVESPYNTYLNQGLPPTPICTPDLAAIEAALHPADSNYLYFLIIEDGDYSNHTFSTTYEDHLAAIERAQRERGAS